MLRFTHTLCQAQRAFHTFRLPDAAFYTPPPVLYTNLYTHPGCQMLHFTHTLCQVQRELYTHPGYQMLRFTHHLLSGAQT